MKKTIQLISCFLITILMGNCNSIRTSQGYKLTANERQLCDSLQFDPTVIQSIRNYNSNKIENFHDSLFGIVSYDAYQKKGSMRLKAVTFKEQDEKSYEVVFALKDSLRRKGYSICLVVNNQQIDYIAVFKTTSQYEILKEIATNGINYDITSDSLISIIREFDKKYALELIGTAGDWCEFTINKEPANWMDFAKEVYKVCPDVVDQGAGTVENLAEEMKKNKRAYFWWD